MNVIIKPIVTEKMTALSEKYNRYGFVVDRRAHKLQIKKAVEDMYGVKVDSVNTLIQRGKDTPRYTKAGMIKGKKSSFKKAIVQLKEGDQIDFYSGI